MGIGYAAGALFGVGAVTLVGLPIGLWKFFHYLARRADQRAMENPPLVVGEPERVTPVLLACAVVVPLLSVITTLLGRLLAVPVAIIGLVAMLSAWVVHGLPGHSRNLKYVLYYLGSAGIGLVFSVRGTSARALEIAGVIGVVDFAVAVACVALLRPDRPLEPGDSSSRRALAAWRLVSWIQGPDVPSILVITALGVVQLGIPYVFIRWCAGARVGRRAVLYLRSFHDDQAGRVFAEVLTPALHRTVAVTGLVHVAQPMSDLSRNVPLLWRSRFVAIADQNWRAWVERHLEAALAVVVDVSVATDSVTWELDRALAVLPPERLLVLHRTGTPAPAGLPSVQYDLSSPAGIGQVRSSLSGWLSRALATADPAVGTIITRVSAQRHQLALLPLIMLGVDIPVLGMIVVAVVSLTRYQFENARINMLRHSMEDIRQAAEMSMLDGARTCPTIDDLRRDRRVETRSPNDPWGTEFRIDCQEDAVVVRSAGPDAQFGTADDLTTERGGPGQRPKARQIERGQPTPYE